MPSAFCSFESKPSFLPQNLSNGMQVLLVKPVFLWKVPFSHAMQSEIALNPRDLRVLRVRSFNRNP